MSRKRKERYIKPTLFIVCEGTKTEPLYFESIGEQIAGENWAFDVKVLETDKTTAVELIEFAQSFISENDPDAQIWAVFDKDGYTKHQEAFKEASKPGKEVHIAFSSIAFEHWVLLHFERNDTAFQKAECKDVNKKPCGCGSGSLSSGFDCKGKNCVIGYLRQKNHYHDYKKTDFIYNRLKDKTHLAIENAAWLRHQVRNNVHFKKGEIYKLNPYTDVDKLVSTLLNRKESVWGESQIPILIDAFKVEVLDCMSKDGGFSVTISLENLQPLDAYLINNTSQQFSLGDDERNPHQYTIKEPVLIPPEEIKNFELLFPIEDLPDAPLLNFVPDKTRPYRLLIPLVYAHNTSS